MKKQRGFGALEVLVVLMISAIAITGGATVWTRYLDRQSNLISSEQMNIVANAATKYIKDNYAAVIAVATPSAPAIITTTILRSTGYLPSGFSDTNAYGQDYRVLALEPTANKLQTLVVTQNGDPIRELYLFEIAKQIGARGGYISSSNTTVALGSFGGWQTALAAYGVSPGAGHLATALFFDDGALVNDYLYRNAVPGQPNLNKMNTSIEMSGHDLNNVGAVNTSSAYVNTNTVTVGTAQSGTTNTLGETYTGGWFRTKGDNGWYNEKYNGGWYMSDPSWVRSYSDKNVYTAGMMAAGTIQSNGRTNVGEYLQLSGVAYEGTGCAPSGLVGRTVTGMTISCQSGVWKSSGAGAVAALGNPGWSCDPGTGMIEQWGSGGALGNDGTHWVTFPRSMTAAYNVTVTAINLPNGSQRGGDMGAYSLSGGSVLIINDDYPVDGYYWRVIGYVPSC